MRHRRPILWAAAVLLALGASLSIEPAQASPATKIDDSGWWWRVRTNPDVPLPAPPTVQPGQLLVQGGPDGATALAAVAATMPKGEAHPVLTLTVAESGDTGGESAILLACQAGSAWTGGDAKAWPEAPTAACDSGGVQGKRSTDGATWTFDLDQLQFTNKVNVVLVPGVVDGQPDGLNGSTFSLTFEKPTTASVLTSPGEPPPTTVAAVPGGGAPPPSADLGGGAVPYDPPSAGGDLDLPGLEPALPEESQGLTPVAPSVQAQNPPLQPAVVLADPRSPHARSVGIVLLLLGAAAVYAATKRQPVIGPEGVTGGLSRWTRPRWGAPPPLRS